MPVLLFVRQILGVDPDNLATLVTSIGEHVLVASDTVGEVFSQDISEDQKKDTHMMKVEKRC